MNPLRSLFSLPSSTSLSALIQGAVATPYISSPLLQNLSPRLFGNDFPPRGISHPSLLSLFLGSPATPIGDQAPLIRSPILRFTESLLPELLPLFSKEILQRQIFAEFLDSTVLEGTMPLTALSFLAPTREEKSDNGLSTLGEMIGRFVKEPFVHADLMTVPFATPLSLSYLRDLPQQQRQKGTLKEPATPLRRPYEEETRKARELPKNRSEKQTKPEARSLDRFRRLILKLLRFNAKSAPGLHTVDSRSDAVRLS